MDGIKEIISSTVVTKGGEIRGTAVFSLILSGMKGAAYFRARIHIRIKLLALSHFLTLLFCLILEAKCKV